MNKRRHTVQCLNCGSWHPGLRECKCKKGVKDLVPKVNIIGSTTEYRRGKEDLSYDKVDPEELQALIKFAESVQKEKEWFIEDLRKRVIARCELIDHLGYDKVKLKTSTLEELKKIYKETSKLLSHHFDSLKL